MCGLRVCRLRHNTLQRLYEIRLRACQRTREAIANAAERLRMNEELATLRLDVPLTEDALVGPMTGEGYAKLGDFFSALEFKSLLPRVEALARLG